MKVLWVCNIMMPTIAEQLSKPATSGGGWLTGLSNDLQKNKDIELTVCFPGYGKDGYVRGKYGNISYCSFPKKITNPTIYEKEVENELKKIIDEFKPDIVHIWGTEFPHSLAMMNVCESEKTVISIQGLCSVIAKHYMAFLPNKIQKSYTIRDFIKRDNLKQQQKKFIKRGNFEIEALRKCKNVIGRTSWDKASVNKINETARYYFANETLRDSFYINEWNIDRCEKHSIFLSQGNYPVKGLHLMLEAMPGILRIYPDAHLYIAGEDITKFYGIKDKFRISTYGKYLLKLINKYDLNKNVTFTGILNEKEMCDRMLKSNVFVCPSSIENSPNSLGEAMLLGIPSVASYVGGIPDMLKHNEEGFLYQCDATYMLEEYVCRIFHERDIALNFSKKSKYRANSTHNKEINSNRIMEIYKDIYNKEVT